MIRTKLVLVLSIYFLYSVRSDVEFGEDEDHIIKDYVEERGYVLESHTIATSDGYELVYHRISELNSPTVESRPPVLLQHGLGLSSAAFLTPDKYSLAYVLVDAGYDVWLANSRGNRYSRKHIFLNSSKEEFWQFSFHELAVEDLSAALDYILHTTGKSRLHFVGHSHGGAFILALLASKPHYQPMFASVTTLAPATFLSPAHIGTVIEKLFIKSIQYEAKGRYHMFSITDELNKMFFDDGTKTNKLLDFFIGTTEEGVWSDALQFQQSGTSTAMIHYVYQQIKNGQVFKHQNYGMEANLKLYNSTEPAIYNLSSIANPISIIFSDSDLLVSEKNFEHHVSHLDKVSFIRINIGKPNHMDFLWNPKVKSIVNKEITQIIKREETCSNKISRDNFNILHFNLEKFHNCSDPKADSLKNNEQSKKINFPFSEVTGKFNILTEKNHEDNEPIPKTDSLENNEQSKEINLPFNEVIGKFNMSTEKIHEDSEPVVEPMENNERSQEINFPLTEDSGKLYEDLETQSGSFENNEQSQENTVCTGTQCTSENSTYTSTGSTCNITGTSYASKPGTKEEETTEGNIIFPESTSKDEIVNRYLVDLPLYFCLPGYYWFRGRCRKLLL